MTFHTKYNGNWAEVGSNSFYVKNNGVWTVVSEAYRRNASGWQQFFINEIAVTLASSTDVDIEAQFDAAVWTSSTPKRIIVPAGVTIGGVSASAITVSATMGGVLNIDNSGDIIGYGGASTGASGGDAVTNLASNVFITNTGLIAGGGGAGGSGGTGGQGGNGSYTSYGSFTPYYSGNSNYNCNEDNIDYGWMRWNNGLRVRWNFTTIGYVAGGYFTSSQIIGGYEYQRGSEFCSDNENNRQGRQVRRRSVTNATSTGGAGGAGGAGGQGQGYNQAAAAGATGSAGANGGTNAGAGGQGGSGASGAAYGQAAAGGATGNTGANGNAGSGSAGAAGSAGGAAGAAVSGTTVTMTNTGTINGTVA